MNGHGDSAPDSDTSSAEASPTAEGRCWRHSGVSGRYSGVQASQGRVTERLELRLDVDIRHNRSSPVLGRVSGDHYLRRPGLGQGAAATETYLRSWVVDQPQVSWEPCRVVITGRVRHHGAPRPRATVTVVTPWSQGTIGPATVTFTVDGVDGAPYSCRYVSNAFRSLELEIDYAASVDVAPDTPRYDTHWHPTRPADLPQRVLTIPGAFRDAGVAVSMSSGRSVIDDSAPGFSSWSPSELHDAMEVAYSRHGSAWPNWRLWGLQAGRFDNAGVGGIMFDAAAAYGGAGRSPERQGFAVFRDHPWFADLVPGVPATQEQARAMRHYLYTWVHEAGHAFNLLHSWDKGRDSSLSWMNYDWKYDQLHGADQFWAGFRFRFDDEELLHIRHGDRAGVIMGGDPWASGGHLEAPPLAGLDPDPEQPVELLVRGKTFFAFMEPVELELRLRNRAAVPVAIDARLDPSHGNTTIIVGRPDGTTTQFTSLMCLYGEPVGAVLAPASADPAAQGPDRHSEQVSLTYGAAGFLFDQPGAYRVRAVYQAGEVLAASPIAVIRVGQPASALEDRFAADFFSTQVGVTLSLGGSMSPYLATGRDTLAEAARRYPDQALGAKASAVVARAVGDDFFRRRPEDGVDVMVKHHAADPQEALALTEPARQRHHAAGGREANLDYRTLVELRADLHVRNGDPGRARSELQTLGADLARRGVNANVLADVQAAADAAGRA